MIARLLQQRRHNVKVAAAGSSNNNGLLCLLLLLLMLLLLCSFTTVNALESPTNKAVVVTSSSLLSSSTTKTKSKLGLSSSATIARRKRKTKKNRQQQQEQQQQQQSHHHQVVVITSDGDDGIDDDKEKDNNNNNGIMISSRGGGGDGDDDDDGLSKTPSMYWAVLHNWMYFLSLGFNLINVPFMIRQIIDGPDRMNNPSPKAIALSGKVESVDKFLTFLGIGFLSALSDKFGRKPLMAWSAIGFMITNLIQAQTRRSIALLYFADFVDGCSSCMLPLCQTYVTDCSQPNKRATNLGIFQGLSAGGAFIFAFPIGGILGAKYGPRIPLLIAAIIQLINALIIIFITPESNPQQSSAHNTRTTRTTTTTTKLDLREANPIGSIHRLFFAKKGNNKSNNNQHLLKIASSVYFLTSLARCSLDAQFANYSNIRFGWTQAQSGPVLVLVGFMLVIGPRLLVPKLGLKNSILYGLIVFALGLTYTGLATTPIGFIFGIMIVSIGCTCLPSLQALLANLAPDNERGALLGAVGSITELTGSIGSTLYAVVLAKFTADDAPLPIPGMHFLVGSALLVMAWLFALPGLTVHKNDTALVT